MDSANGVRAALGEGVLLYFNHTNFMRRAVDSSKLTHRYLLLMSLPDKEETNSVAIIGAGLCGLTAALKLAKQGVAVQVLEKGPLVGGRMSVHSTEAGPVIDHGAKFFTVNSDALRSQTDAWIAAGVVAEWKPKIASLGETGQENPFAIATAEPQRYIGVPGMNAPVEQLATEAVAEGAQVSTDVRVASLKRVGTQWRLTSDTGESLGDFARVLIATPAPQAAELLTASPALANAAKSVRFASWWTAVVSFREPIGVDFETATVKGPKGASLSWIIHDNSKPGRTAGNDWVLHSSPAWSADNADFEPTAVLEQLLNEFWRVTGATPIEPTFSLAYRWRYALPETALAEAVLIDHDRGLYAAGDWCGQPNAEGAYLSGLAAAEAILQF